VDTVTVRSGKGVASHLGQDGHYFRNMAYIFLCHESAERIMRRGDGEFAKYDKRWATLTGMLALGWRPN
jgi:hypothetical protein